MKREYTNQELGLHGAEIFQWIREAHEAISSADTARALSCLRNATNVALLAAERHGQGRQGDRILDFAPFIGIHGDVCLARDVSRLAECIATSDGERNPWAHKIAESLEQNLDAYISIRECVEVDPGSAQASLAKMLGMPNSRFAQLASDLCDAAVIVAANRKGRVYLWPADDPAAPAEPERRPSGWELSLPPELNSFTISGAEWERIRLDFEAKVAQAGQQPEPSFTFLDIVTSMSAVQLSATAGVPLLFDGEDNAIGYGHLELDAFHAVAQSFYSEHASRPAKDWHENVARHSWMILEMRDGAGEAILREVDEEYPGSSPVTVITGPRRNTDPARVRSGRHVWLPDSVNESFEAPAADSEETLGSKAIETLINSGIAPDVGFPRWHQRQWHTEMRTGKILDSGEIPWKLEHLEPMRDTYSEEIVQAWILGPDRAQAVAEAEAARAAGEVWNPHPELCLISLNGARLRGESSRIPGRDGGISGKGGWRYTWIETTPLETVTCGVKQSITASLSALVAKRISDV